MGLLDLLLILTLTPHLAAVGFAGVAPLVALGLEWRGARRENDLPDRVARYLAAQSMLWLCVGMLLGAAALGISWLRGGDAYFDAFRAFPLRRYWFGAAELAFSLGCLALYVRWRPRKRSGRVGHRLLALLASTNLLYHFPALFTAVAVLVQRGAAGEVPFLSMLADAEVLARVAHYLMAAVAATGVFLLLAARSARFRADEAINGRIARWGGRLALPATLLQIPLGVYLLLVMPPLARQRLMFADPLASLLLAGGLATALGLMHQLAAAALGGCSPAEARRSAALFGLTLLLMVAARQQSRERTDATQPAATVATPAAIVATANSILWERNLR